MNTAEKPNMLKLLAGAETLGEMVRATESSERTILLKDLVGGALSAYAAALIARTGGVHLFVAEDRDAAAYLLNDLYGLLDESRIYFFPTSYKRSIVYGTEDPQGIVQRTAALNALRESLPAGDYRVLCTYPEALAERVTDPDAMGRKTIQIKVGDKLAIADLEQRLIDSGFTRVDFVYEPGQYSIRGGIFDLFSYSESKPFRLDFSATRWTPSAVSRSRASSRPTRWSRYRSSPNWASRPSATESRCRPLPARQPAGSSTRTT